MDLEKVDFLTEIDSLRRGWQACQARLAAVETERDAARAEVESTWRCFRCGFCTTDYKQAEAHFGDRDEEMALCQWWKDSTDAERVQALQDAIEEQNAARAGEARAVEALVKLSNEIGGLCFEEAAIRTIIGNTNWSVLQQRVDEARAILDACKPALDWLAQQRREAAAEENERWANEWWELARPSSLIASDFIARAAALRAGEVGDE